MLTAKNINFTYRKTPVINQINLAVKRGEMLIIIGPNGAGKSTLLNILANEITGNTGTVFFKNKDFAYWESRKLARHKAKFSQEYNPDIGLLVKEVVLMGRYPYFTTTPSNKDWEIVESVMQETDVQQFSERGYTTLSGGEKQRVHLARVMAQLKNNLGAKAAFFDEPLNNLDVRYQHQILEKIRQFVKQGNSAVVVLHDLNLAAEFADRIVLLKQGGVLADGDPKQIFRQSLIQKAYDFPCAVCANPVTQCPMIIFGKQLQGNTVEF